MTGKLYWAKMPLNYEKLKEIPESHRIRQYLIFMNADDENFYAFASTHKMPEDCLQNATRVI